MPKSGAILWREDIAMFRRRIGVVAFFVVCLIAPLAAAQPRLQDSPPAETRIVPYSAVLPTCEDGILLARIQRGFDDAEREFWSSALAIESFAKVRETGFRTDGLSYIPRRRCEAAALFNDGARRTVVYEIAEDMGFIGMGSGLTWCVVGLDRNHAFSPHCKAVGP
jgi:hypothetical protein